MPRWVPSVATGTFLGLSLMLVAVHAELVEFDGGGVHDAEQRHAAILAGEGESPWAYRVAVPLAVEVAAHAVPWVEPWSARRALYLAVELAATAGLLVLFERYLRAWLEPAWATAGVLLLAALHPITFHHYWFSPDTRVDLLVWVAAAALTQTGRDAWLFPLVCVAVLNRETAVFAIVVHACLRAGQEPAAALAARCAALAACAAIPAAAVRLAIGTRPSAIDPTRAWMANLDPLWIAWALAFVAPLAAATFSGWSRRPLALRRLLVALLVGYLPLVLVFGRIREVRLLLPLAIPAVPLAMLALREGTAERR